MANGLDAALLFLAAAFFMGGIWRRLKRISIGEKESSGELAIDVKGALADIFSHKKILEGEKGIGHLFAFYAFLTPLLFIALAQFSFTVARPVASVLSLLLDALGVLGFYGLVRLALARKAYKKAENRSSGEDWAILTLLLAIYLTGFWVEGIRLSAVPDANGYFAPAGFLFSLPLKGLSPATSAAIAQFARRLHLFLALFFVAAIPWCKMGHAIFGGLNIVLTPRRAAKLTTPEIEESEYFGAGHIEKFSRKALLDLEACVNCGRCEEACPAFVTGKPLSPRKFIQDLLFRLKKDAAPILAGKSEGGVAIVGDGEMEAETLWSCTTCLNCVQSCPMAVNHVEKIVSMRRYEVLMEGRMPAELITFNKNLEKNYNPWGLGWSGRDEWLAKRGVDAPIFDSPDCGAEILLWVGCAGAFDDRYQRAMASLARLMQSAGVNFAILGNAEKCCGEPARVSGNEYLFQEFARQNIEKMTALGIKKIVTACPHCLKTLATEYPDFGGKFEVVHHSAFLADLLKSGRLKSNGSFKGVAAVHDSCYLARHAGISAEPRELALSAGLSLAEMDRRKKRTFCCGGGGARMWLEEKGRRAGDERAAEALSTEASVIATACPFCLAMLSDGVKAAGKEESAEVLDLAEALERGLA